MTWYNIFCDGHVHMYRILLLCVQEVRTVPLLGSGHYIGWWCPCVELKQAINGLDIQIVRKQQWSRSAPAVCWLLRQVWEASVQCCVVRAAGTGLAGAGIQPVSQLASCEQHGACNNCCSQHRTLYAAHQGRTLQLLHVMARVSAVSCHARSILRRSRPGHNCNGKYLRKPF